MVETCDKIWYYKELKKDKLCRSLTRQAQEWIVREAITFGENAAAIFQQNHNILIVNEKEMIRLIEQAGAKLRKQPSGLVAGRLAEYDESSHEIICYTDLIARIEKKMAALKPNFLNNHSLITLCIAHELFHHLGNTCLGPASSRIRVEVRWLGLFKRRKPTGIAREIAAHAFVKRFLGLPCSPAVVIDEIMKHPE